MWNFVEQNHIAWGGYFKGMKSKVLYFSIQETESLEGEWNIIQVTELFIGKATMTGQELWVPHSILHKYYHLSFPHPPLITFPVNEPDALVTGKWSYIDTLKRYRYIDIDIHIDIDTIFKIGLAIDIDVDIWKIILANIIVRN